MKQKNTNIQKQVWENLSDDARNEILAKYKKYVTIANDIAFDEADEERISEAQAMVKGLEDMFGDIIIPKRNPVWSELSAKGAEVDTDYLYGLDSDGGSDEGHNCIVFENCYHDDKLIDKNIATFKIASIINEFYGGLVTDFEIDNDSCLWSIECDSHGLIMVKRVRSKFVDKLLLFRSEAQAKEFKSFEDNVALIYDYYMVKRKM